MRAHFFGDGAWSRRRRSVEAVADPLGCDYCEQRLTDSSDQGFLLLPQFWSMFGAKCRIVTTRTQWASTVQYEFRFAIPDRYDRNWANALIVPTYLRISPLASGTGN